MRGPKVVEVGQAQRGRVVAQVVFVANIGQVVIALAQLIHGRVGAVDAKPPAAEHLAGLFRVAGTQRAPVAGRQVLDGLKREAGKVGDGANGAALVRSPGRMGGIFNQHQAVLGRQLLQLGHVAGVAAPMHGHNGLGARGDAVLDVGRVDVAGGVLNIGKNWLGTYLHHRQGRGDKGLGRKNHFVAGAHPGYFQRQVQGARARVERRGVHHAQFGAQACFKLFNELAFAEKGACQHSADALGGVGVHKRGEERNRAAPRRRNGPRG